jgi:DnaD and phage-associated domain
MIKYLRDSELIDFKGLLILKYKSLDLNEEEVMVLLLIISLQNQDVKTITPQLLSDYMSLSVSKIDYIIVQLIKKALIVLDNISISIEPLYDNLLKSKEEVIREETKKLNLIETFENEFARTLSPMEMETIMEWKQKDYKDEHILLALKEATLSNVHSLRYIEKILIDWAKHGVKTSKNHRVEKEEETIELVDYKWWLEE